MSDDAPKWARSDWPILRIKKYRLHAESVFFIITAYQLLFDRSGEVSIDIHDAGYCDR